MRPSRHPHRGRSGSSTEPGALIGTLALPATLATLRVLLCVAACGARLSIRPCRRCPTSAIPAQWRTKMACIQDLLGHYRLSPTTTEEEILRAAEEILTRRFQNDREAITDPVKAGRIFKMRLAHEPNEIFCVMFLD